VKVKILESDAEKERVSLGIKQLDSYPFADALGGVSKGAVVTCTVTASTDKGVEVSVNEKLTGFIKKGDLSRERSEQRPDRFAVGEKVDAKVLKVDRSGRKLELSIKQKEIDDDKKAMAEYGSSDSGASLGDILGAAMAKKGATASDEPAAEAPKKAKK